VEIYQNCPIFNDGAFQMIKDRDQGRARLAHLIDGEQVAVGEDQVVVRHGAAVRVVPTDQAAAEQLEVVVHDSTAADPAQAFALSRLDDGTMAHVPMGIFRQVQRPTYDDQVRAQVDAARASAGGPVADDELQQLLRGKDTWTVAG
jgi:2-oxoglutarate ferredoxin oxidoreductase subunit beta